MLYKRKKAHSKRKKKVLAIALVIAILLVGYIIYFESYADPYQVNMMENRAKIIATESITQGIENILAKGEFTYESFSKITYGSSGAVQSISIDSVNVNKFKNELSKEIQRIMQEEHPLYYEVPLGAFSGFTLLANYGPNIPISFTLGGSFNSKLNSSFETAGNNQTVHHITLDVDADMISMAPGNIREFELQSNYEIAQTVIVGDVSNYYWGNGTVAQ
jgi:sporulation protein YunB